MAKKLLGIHIAEEIMLGVMQELRVKLERGLQQLQINPTSLIGRVTTINNLILSSLWFVVALWVGLDSELKAYEKEITRFLWSEQGQRKRHRVVEFILYLLRENGGLGVLSIQHQWHALAGKFILWAMKPGLHPLQVILRASIQHLSYKRWGLLDYSWALVPCNILPKECSNICTNICRSWNYIKKVSHQLPLQTWLKFREFQSGPRIWGIS